MLFFTFLLLIVVEGSFGYSEDCKERQRKECGESWFTGIPENTKELKEACKKFSEFGRCAVNITKECSENEKLLNKMRNLLNYADSVCKEESPVFQVLSKHQACIRDAINSDAVSSDCRMIENITEKNKEIINSHRRELVENGIYINEYKEYCIHIAWINQCSSISLGIQCGSEVKEILSEVGRKVGRYVVPEEACDDNALQEASEFLNGIYEKVLIEERYGGNISEGK